MKKLTAQAVIGAGYGDEGKGRVTDWLAAQAPGAVVVRSNGGAQAGHTVVTPAGARHVFHHFGAGALAGAATHLSRCFVAHPMLFAAERATLAALGGRLDVTSDPRAPVTTPFDVLINQIVEAHRGTARHGSCGLGFGETIERNLVAEFATSLQTLFRPDLGMRLRHIRDHWVPTRLARLGIPMPTGRLADTLSDNAIITRFLDDCAAYTDHVQLWPDRRLGQLGPVIFEAAQGLLLDQDFGAFPYVTRSNTGLRNMLAIATEAGIDHIDAIYVTRSYLTRHGAGPLGGEVARVDGIAVDDPTNAPNDWQGTIRLAPLDLLQLQAAIAADLALAAGGTITVTAGLAVTCLDRATAAIPVRHGATLRRLAPATVATHIAAALSLPLFGAGWGPSRQDFRPSAAAHPTIAAA